MKSIKRRMAKAILATGTTADNGVLYCRHCKACIDIGRTHKEGCIVLEAMRIASTPQKEKEPA